METFLVAVHCKSITAYINSVIRRQTSEPMSDHVHSTINMIDLSFASFSLAQDCRQTTHKMCTINESMEQQSRSGYNNSLYVQCAYYLGLFCDGIAMAVTDEKCYIAVVSINKLLVQMSCLAPRLSPHHHPCFKHAGVINS